MSEVSNRPLAAAAMVLAAMALFGLIDNFVRLGAAEGGLWQFHLLRSVVALVVLVPFAWLFGLRLWPRSWPRVLGRSLLNTVAMVIYFACLGFMPIAQAVAGLFTAPLFVVIFQVMLFGDRIGPRRIFAVLLGFAGIVLALRPEAGALSLWTLLPVLAGALYGLGNIVTRRFCLEEGPMALLGVFFAMMLGWGAIGVAVLATWPLPVAEGADGFATRGWVAPVGIFGWLIVVQGVGSLIGVGLSIRAYQIADSTMVAVFENALLVFATIWAFVLWREAPDALGLLGLALIAAAGVIIALRTEDPGGIRAAPMTDPKG